MSAINILKKFPVRSFFFLPALFIFVSLLLFPVFSLADVVYEDAEDGLTEGWLIFDANPGGAGVSNVYDAERGSQVIEFSGSGTANGYVLRNADGSPWGNPTQRVIEWSMKYSEECLVYVDVMTDAGRRKLKYKPINNHGGHDLGACVSVSWGIGTNAKNGQWHTFVRDLQADLTAVQPGAAIEAVNAFYIRGSGRVDDIKLLDEFPSGLDYDGDGVTDKVEFYLKTDPYTNDLPGPGIHYEYDEFGRIKKIYRIPEE